MLDPLYVKLTFEVCVSGNVAVFVLVGEFSSQYEEWKVHDPTLKWMML